jgi:hypothetical protein
MHNEEHMQAEPYGLFDDGGSDDGLTATSRQRNERTIEKPNLIDNVDLVRSQRRRSRLTRCNAICCVFLPRNHNLGLALAAVQGRAEPYVHRYTAD